MCSKVLKKNEVVKVFLKLLHIEDSTILNHFPPGNHQCLCFILFYRIFIQARFASFDADTLACSHLVLSLPLRSHRPLAVQS